MSTGLVFYERSHRYKLDGQWVQGVTTIIGNGLPKKALMYWSAKTVAEWVASNPDLTEDLKRLGGYGPTVAFLKELPWQKRDTAAIRGTEVHDLAERLAHGEEVDVPEHLSGYVQGYVDWLDQEQPEVIWTERPVGNRKWQYAGKFDLIVRMRGKVWLLDNKTSSSVYGDNAVQLAAYANAEFLVDPDGNEVPLPQIDELGVLHVTDHGTTLHRVTDADAAWKDFLHIKWVADAGNRIKTYLEPDDQEKTA